MKKYIEAQQSINEIIINNSVDNDELERFSLSDKRWANYMNDRNQFSKRIIKKGEVYQFDFGKNYIPEMSYEHRGLVIGVKGQLLYVLPIYSYSSSKHKDAYHPIDNPQSKSDLFLLKSSEFSFLSHDSILKLNDIRSISTKRILYKHNGRIDIHSDTYSKITSLVFQKYFGDYYYELQQCKEEIKLLNQKIAELKSGHEDNQ